MTLVRRDSFPPAAARPFKSLAHTMSQNDPRDVSLEVKYCPPSIWRTESVGAYSVPS
ncbi:hypothetical protein EWM64_g5770 [Hericium alpestre]|uniref:Uncharacterized protein n=1 Tax=Hericium alpestre TaxID=135208 RepID=A0A4Y9ZWG6_9AGAM|nr:hypothetical protein EWM64_g5770 [Hericium alpestre]